ncbi:MAG: class I SAM-dependent methyltransferase [Gaiellales bacterium]
MGRYSRPLAGVFADAAGILPGQRALDLGCGPGALTSELVARLGAEAVCAVDPSPEFVQDCAARNPGVDVRLGQAESIPFGDGEFDAALAQLVLHFVSDPPFAASEMRRVVRPGGTVAACVWDFAEEMRMLRLFWDAALTIDPSAPDEARTLRFSREGELSGLLSESGLSEVVETTLSVESSYSGFDELWAGFLQGIGPAGWFCLSLADDRRELLRTELFRRLGSPSGGFTLPAKARCATGRVP